MATTIILGVNFADAGSMEASTKASGSFTADNLQDVQRTTVWRSEDGTTSYVDLTRADTALDAVDYAGFVDVNLRPTGSIRIQSWSDDILGSSPGVDLPVTPATIASDIEGGTYGGIYDGGNYGGSFTAPKAATGNVTIADLTGSYTDKYWRFTFTDADSPFQECGRIFLSEGLSFGINAAYGWSVSREDVGDSLLSIGGQRYTQVSNSRRTLKGAFDILDDDERTSLLRKVQQLGDSEPLIFSLLGDNAEGPRHMNIYGTFRNVRSTGRACDVNSVAFEIYEEL